MEKAHIKFNEHKCRTTELRATAKSRCALCQRSVYEMKKIWILQAIATAMLLWALNPENPYGYYILLRWVCCAIFAYLAIQAIAQEKQGWVWVLGVTAVVYNPIFRIHLTREIWSVINIASIIVAIASIFILRVEIK